MLSAGASTVPFGIDDPGLRKNLRNDLNDVIFDIYNRNQSATLCRGVKHPKLIPIIATNYALRQGEVTFLSLYHDIFDIVCLIGYYLEYVSFLL